MKIRRNIFLFKLYFLLGDLWPLSALAIVYFQQISGSYALAMGVFSVANLVLRRPKRSDITPVGISEML